MYFLNLKNILLKVVNSMNNNPKLSKSQLDELIGAASKASGLEAESIKRAVDSGNADNLLKRLKPGDAQRIHAALTDPEVAAKLLATPQAQMIMRKLKGQ